MLRQPQGRAISVARGPAPVEVFTRRENGIMLRLSPDSLRARRPVQAGDAEMDGLLRELVALRQTKKK